jgi:hypothetical protein
MAVSLSPHQPEKAVPSLHPRCKVRGQAGVNKWVHGVPHAHGAFQGQ